MAYNTKAIKTDLNAKPIPQLYNPVTDEYEVLQGVGGAARQVLYGPDGQPISTTGGKLAVRAAELETKIEAVRVLLNTLAGEDFATQTTLAQILGKMIAAPATEAKQDVIAGHADGVETLLTALTGKDFATQTTLAQILAKMIANPATEAKQDSLATLVGAIEEKLDGVIDGTTPATTQLTDGKVKNAFEIIPDDATDLSHETIAIYVGFDGDLKVDLVGGDTVTMYNLAAGAWHPIQAKRVYATGTAATYILGAY